MGGTFSAKIKEGQDMATNVDESNWTVLPGAIITGLSDLPEPGDPRIIWPHDRHYTAENATTISKPKRG